MFKKNNLLPHRLMYYVWKDLTARKQAQKTIDDDESIHDFISQHFDTDLAETLIDPVMKGICGGDIKQLSAASLLQSMFEAEREHGSIIKGMLRNAKSNASSTSTAHRENREHL